ncbi:MAG: hypothetical protein RLY20_1570 [Verrucomicrobiota bacterium]|jgi:hypothetical protein
MNTTSVQTEDRSLGALLRGEVAALTAWTANWRALHFSRDVTLIVVGAGLFGAAMGCWRDPWQALYAGIKLPLILLLTATANGLLNAMLAPLLGLRIAFRQSFLAILASFALAAAILGAFSPLAAFVIWNAPPLTEGAHNADTRAAIMLLLVVVIAFAGIAANVRLLQLLRSLAGGKTAALRVLFAWLAANLFFGSQLSWVLRPFIGSPLLPVQFLRPDAFKGGFFDDVFHALVQIFN